MSKKARWQQVSPRNWAGIAPVWVGVATAIPELSSKPEPGLDKLPGLLAIGHVELCRFADVEGIRKQVLWEALYLYLKCDHSKCASERLAEAGMPSWSMFNAYHSAYLGARSILWLLGLPLPDLAGHQVFVDLFPDADTNRAKRRHDKGGGVYSEFLVKSIGKLDQRGIWDCLQRVLKISTVEVWNSELVETICGLNSYDITPPRNHFLYKPGYWIFDDLESDIQDEYNWLVVSESVNTTDKSFLLWLCYAVHHVLTSLIMDMASRSALINRFFSATRCQSSDHSHEGATYRKFCAATIKTGSGSLTAV